MDYRELKLAIKGEYEVILTLEDGSTLTGVPSWGEGQRIKVKANGGICWIPLKEVKHVTRLQILQKKAHQHLG